MKIFIPFPMTEASSSLNSYNLHAVVYDWTLKYLDAGVETEIIWVALVVIREHSLFELARSNDWLSKTI